MQISGCSAIVTGGTGGMGEATVRRLHAAGVDVHGGPAAGGRLLGKDGSPMGLDGALRFPPK